MVIRLYKGEFLATPIPLELALNTCSYGCSYCFANLNTHRIADVSKVLNQIKNAEKGKTLTSKLLREGYPILFSNLVDPFCESNYRVTVPLVEQLTTLGTKLAFQTKGGKGIKEVLDTLNYKAAWYISVSFYDEKKKKEVEVNSPSIQDRLELISLLKSKGHHVCIGMNPLVEDWLPHDDFDKLLDEFEKRGVKDIWMEPIKFTSKQLQKMSEANKLRVTEPVIKEGLKKQGAPAYYLWALERIEQKGFNLFYSEQFNKTLFFNKYHELYKTFKTHQDFLNHCIDTKKDGDSVFFSEYYEFMSKGNEDVFEYESSECDGYIYRNSQSVWKKYPEVQNKRTLKQVMEARWNYPELNGGLLKNSHFQQLLYRQGEELFTPYDDHRKLIYIFREKLETSYFYYENQPESIKIELLN